MLLCYNCGRAWSSGTLVMADAASSAKCCVRCASTVTPCWRSGPGSFRLTRHRLCNTCGLLANRRKISTKLVDLIRVADGRVPPRRLRRSVLLHRPPHEWGAAERLALRDLVERILRGTE